MNMLQIKILYINIQLIIKYGTLVSYLEKINALKG